MGLAYEAFVDIWRLARKYRFQKLDDKRWEQFIADADKLLGRYRKTEAETLFRYLFKAVHDYYEQISV